MLSESEIDTAIANDLDMEEREVLDKALQGMSRKDRLELYDRVGASAIFVDTTSAWEKQLGVSQPQNFTEYMNHNLGWVFACTRAKAAAVAAAKMGCFRKVGKQWKELESTHPLCNLFAQPNPFTTRSELLYRLIVDLELLGNGYWFMAETELGKKMEDPFVKELWSLPANEVRVVPGETMDTFIKGYIHTPGGRDKDKVPYDASQILHFKYPNTKDPYYGVGTLVGAAHAVNVDEHIDAAQDHTFRNVCFPGVVLQKIGDTEETKKLDRAKRKVVELYLRRFVGAKRAGRSLILDGTWKFDSWGDKSAEMDFQQSSELIRKKILAVFSTGPAIFGMLENASRANMEAAQYAYAKWNIDPTLMLIQERLNAFLVPKFVKSLVPGSRGTGKYEELRVEFEPTVPRDESMVLTRANSGLERGAISPNEWRMEVYGWDPLPKVAKTRGDTPWVGLAKVPLLDIEGEEPPAPPPKAPSKEEDESEEEAVEEEEDEEDVKKKKGFRSLGSNMTPAELADYLADPVAEARALDRKMKPHVWDLVKKGALTEAETVGPAQVEQAAEGEVRADEDYDIKMDSKPFVDALEERAEKHWKDTIANTNRDELLKVIRSGIADGLSPLDIADLIDESIVTGAAGRARNIAQTETIGSLNSGAQALRESRGIPYKEWISTYDQVVRETHLKADGQIRAADKKFRVGAAWLRYPADAAAGHPEEVCQCRCASSGTYDKDGSVADTRAQVGQIWIRQYDAEAKAVEQSMSRYFREYRKRVQARIKAAV